MEQRLDSKGTVLFHSCNRPFSHCSTRARPTHQEHFARMDDQERRSSKPFDPRSRPVLSWCHCFWCVLRFFPTNLVFDFFPLDMSRCPFGLAAKRHRPGEAAPTTLALVESNGAGRGTRGACRGLPLLGVSRFRGEKTRGKRPTSLEESYTKK